MSTTALDTTKSVNTTADSKFNKEEVIKKLMAELEAFRVSQQREKMTNDGGFLQNIKGNEVMFSFSNEDNFRNSVRYMEGLPKDKSNDKVKIGIFVGPAFLLSRLPELEKQIDVLIMVDIQPIVLDHNLFMLDTLKNAKDPEAFFQKYGDKSKNPLLKKPQDLQYWKKVAGQERVSDSDYLKFQLKQDEEGEGWTKGYSFFRPNRYPTCQSIAKQLSIASCLFNFLDLKMAGKLINLIKNVNNACEVSMVYVSNIADYDADVNLQKCMNSDYDHTYQAFHWNKVILQVLQTLFQGNKTPRILFSTLQTQNNFAGLGLQCANSIAEYERALENYHQHVFRAFSWTRPKPTSKTTSKAIPAEDQKSILNLFAQHSNTNTALKENTAGGSSSSTLSSTSISEESGITPIVGVIDPNNIGPMGIGKTRGLSR